MSDGRKKSWREIDQAKDQSRHRGGFGQLGDMKSRHGSKKSYKSALESLFDSGKIADLVEKEETEKGIQAQGDEKKYKLLREIRQAEEPSAIAKAIQSYAKDYEMPHDADLLAKILEHGSDRVQIDAMEALLVMVKDEELRPKRTKAMVGRLKLIVDMDEDPRACKLANELIELFD